MHNRYIGSFSSKRESDRVTPSFWEWASPVRQQCVVLWVRSLNSDLVTVMHNQCLGSIYMQHRQQHSEHPILRMNIAGASPIFSSAAWVIDVRIGCRHPYKRYWQPLTAKTTATCSLPHPENQHQLSVNSFRCCIFHNQGIARIFVHITESLTAWIRNNTIFQR